MSDESIQSLVSDMLRGGNPLTVGVGTIIEVIRKNNSDYDMDNGAPDAVPSSNDPIYLGSLLRTFAKHIPDFMALILSPTHTVPDGESTMTRTREDLSVAFGSKIEPLGFDRFKTCELMAELLHCSNMGLLNESGSEAYVRQRDEERDRRKAEGSLTSSIPPTAEVPDLLDNAGDINNQLSEALNGSPQGTRELGVTNNAEDDGFEDVSAPAELEDDIKEEFDEKDTFELESKPAQTQIFAKQTRPRLDLDEEFVDEPLTSPKMEAIDLTEATSPIGASTAASQEPDATSPIHELSSECAGLNVESNPPTAEDDNTVTLPSFHDGEAAAPAPLNVHPSNGAPPLPARAPLNQPKAPDENSQPELSSHPGDKPAPLFAKRPEGDRHEDGAEQVGEAMMGEGNSQGTIDTTGGEEGDSARSMTMSTNDQTFEPQIESDDNGEPLVGDLLKMMFVEHKVVPTILVSHPPGALGVVSH